MVEEKRAASWIRIQAVQRLYIAAVIDGDFAEADRLKGEMHDHLDALTDAQLASVQRELGLKA